MILKTKKSITIFLLFIVIIKGSTALYAQTTCKSGYLSTPDVFTNYSKKSYMDQIYNNEIDLRTLESNDSYCWVVYSDRDNNSLFYTIDGRQKSDTLSFMERLTVKEVRGNWLLVYSQVLMKDGVEERDVERGWIKAENLILSNKAALLNDKSSTKKAMILVSVSNLDPSTMNSFKNELENKKFYNGPSTSSRFENKRTAKKFKIYYILKETQNMVLLSSSDKLSGSSELLSGGRVSGWMLKLNITNWDHRVCLESSYGNTAVKNYENSKIPIFTDDEKYIKDFISNGDYTTSKAHIIKYLNIERKRKDPYIMRMPILGTDNNQPNIKRVASIARMEVKGAGPEGEIVAAKKKIVRLKNAVNNVDVMFIVDATMSMSKYYKAINKSIQNIISNNQLTGTNAKLRFGIAVYRDYADGDQAFEIQPLTSDYNTVLAKVSTIVCESKDFDIPEAQYQGLIKGIQQAGFNKKHSNVVVLIGDAGNHDPDSRGYTVAKVVDEMNKYNINLIAFQVIAGSNISFQKFNWDAQDYLYNAANVIVNDNTKVKLTQISTNNTYKLTYGNGNKDNAFMMFGRFTYASANRAMSTEILEQNINNSTDIYIKKIQKEIALLENILGGEGGKQGIYTPEFIDYLKRMGFTQDQIKLLMNLGEISSKGRTSIKYFNKSTECFYPVVFLSADEKDKIDRTLNKLKKWGGIGSKKQALKTALTQQAMDMLGAPKDVVENKTMNDIWDIILGVPFSGDSRISKLLLRDLNKLDDNTFKEFYSKFRNQAKKFTNNPFDDSMFEMAGQRFYWIPLDKFPGNE